MKVNNQHYLTVWQEGGSVMMIEQNLLPFEFKIIKNAVCEETCEAIKTMKVRGAIALGAAAGFAMAQGFAQARENNFWEDAQKFKQEIEATRPTAKNLFFATERVFKAGQNAGQDFSQIRQAAWQEAQKIADESREECRLIGEYGEKLIQDGFGIETHCNAGWLGCVDYGTALAPFYLARQRGKNFLVYADETRPRGQGARLTAWELKNENVPHVIIPDNAGAYLMAQGKINLMIVGADRIAANGDTANKIGTFEKAIVAKKFKVPFYVAAPLSTFDLKCASGADIPIEERSEDEVLYQTGPTSEGKLEKILVCSPGSRALNPAFDVTPAEYITGIITEKGIIRAEEEAIRSLF